MPKYLIIRFGSKKATKIVFLATLMAALIATLTKMKHNVPMRWMKLEQHSFLKISLILVNIEYKDKYFIIKYVKTLFPVLLICKEWEKLF